VVTGSFGICPFTTGKAVNSSVVKLRPGVDGDVAFREKGQAGDALRLEFMRRQVEERRP
jgi:hypothetical protein